MTDKVIYKELSYAIYGICFKAHNELGRFRTEKIYGDHIQKQLDDAGITYKREYELKPSFIGEHQRRNRVDFLIENKIILDIKAKPIITKDDYFQMKRYLDSSDKKLGLIVNFRQPHIYPKRVLKL